MKITDNLPSPNKKQESNTKADPKELVHDVMEINQLIQEGDQKNSNSLM
jgi:hypothetical protein